MCEHRYGGSPGSEPPSTVSKQIAHVISDISTAAAVSKDDANRSTHGDNSRDYNYGLQARCHVSCVRCIRPDGVGAISFMVQGRPN